LTDLINTEWIPAAKNADLSALLSQAGPALETHGKMAADLWQKVRPER
jgi:hypothetical protein